MVCTDRLAHEVWAKRICQAPGAEHTFEAYISARAILKNLASSGTAGILMDQNTSLQEGIFVDLFGVMAHRADR